MARSEYFPSRGNHRRFLVPRQIVTMRRPGLCGATPPNEGLTSVEFAIGHSRCPLREQELFDRGVFNDIYQTDPLPKAENYERPEKPTTFDVSNLVAPGVCCRRMWRR